MVLTRSLSFILLFIFCLVSHAQHRFRQITTEDGLIENAVTDVFQDSEGYLWIATQDGLSQYDGYRFTNYNLSSSPLYSLSDNYLWGISEDTLGNLWVCSRNGLSRLNKKTKEVNRFYTNYEGIGNTHNQIMSVHFFKGYMYCSWDLGIYRLPVKEKYDTTDILLTDQVNRVDTVAHLRSGFIEDSIRNQLYCLTYDGLLDIKANQIITSQLYLNDKKVSKFIGGVQGPRGKLWLHSSSNIYYYDPGEDSLQRLDFDFSNVHLYTLAFHNNELWVGTDNGLYVFHENKQLKYHLVKESKGSNALSSNQLTSILADRSGKMWLGSSSTGLSLYDQKDDRFKCLRVKPLTDNYRVNSMVQSGKRLFISTNEGLLMAKLKSEALTLSRFASDQVLSIEPLLEEYNILPSQLEVGLNGDILIGTRNQGLFVLDANLKLIKRTHWPIVFEEFDVVTDILLSSKGQLWVSTENGLYILNSDYDLVKTYRARDKGLKTSYFLTLFEDAEGVIWLGSNAGAIKYLEKEDQFKHYQYVKDDPEHSPAFIFVSGFVDFGDGNLWMATYGGGLSVMNKSTESFKHYDSENGLVNNVCNGLLSDGQNLWINTNKGISKFDVERQTFVNYDQTDGLLFNEFNLNADYQNKQGELFFGSRNGLVVFHPNQIQSSAYHAAVVFTDFWVNYESAMHCVDDDSIELYPEDKAISIHFAALNFSQSTKVRYQFRLKGYSDKWVETTELKATYTSLPHGEYWFEVKACNEDGIWNTVPKVLTIMVHPPFYLEWWFILFASMVLTGLSILTIRYFAQRKIKKQLRALKIEQAVQQEKERISRDLHDNIGSQITYLISSIDREAYLNKADRDAFDKLGDKARSMMTQLRQTIWIIKKEQISLEDFIQKIRDYLTKVLEPTELSSKVDLKGEASKTLKPTIVSHLFRIVQEAVTNTIKHAEAQHLEIRIEAEHKTLKLCIQDDGIGIQNVSLLDGSFGLKNMEDRVLEMKGQWKIEDRKGCYLEIVISYE